MYIAYTHTSIDALYINTFLNTHTYTLNLCIALLYLIVVMYVFVKNVQYV